MAEQFPDGDRVVLQAYRAQVAVGGVVQAEQAIGGQPEHGGPGDQPGQAGHREQAAGLQRLGPVQVGMSGGDDPGRAAGVAPRQEQGGHAQFGAGLLGDRGDPVRRVAEGPGRRRILHPGVGDPVAEREAAQAGQPVRRRRIGRRHQPHACQLNLGLERRLADDDELTAQARLAGLFGQGAGRDRGQETVVEVLAELVLAGRRPARAPGPGEPFGHPEQVGEGMATGGAGLLQPGPAGQAVLPGDGGLGGVQGDELARGQAAFRLEFQVTQARPGGQCPRRMCSR